MSAAQPRLSAKTPLVAAIAAFLIAVSPPAVRSAAAAAATADPDAGLRELICRMVDGAAAANRLPSAFLARILWQESRLRSEATSPAGAQGVAQFMPQTAAERGLADPRDTAPAIAEAARFLAELSQRFGNRGLAAAAYNAGAGRVMKWLQAQSDLPAETRHYVNAVTGRPVEDWASREAARQSPAEDGEPCLVVMSELARSTPGRGASPGWLAQFDRNLARYLAARTRQREAELNSLQASFALCDSLRTLGARCEVYQP
jgi:hypothetical protein